MSHMSLWKILNNEPTSFSPLQNDTNVDVAIVGAGITGLTTALTLLKQGKTVAVLEANTIGNGTTAYSTGNLYLPIQPFFQTILSKFDEEAVKYIAASRNEAIDFIEKQVKELNIACHFARRPWYMYTDDENKIDFLHKEMDIFKKINFPMQAISDLPLPLKFKKAAMLENQARINPLQYIFGLSTYLSQNGCQIYENSRVISITEQKGKTHLETAHGKVTANHTVIATHTPLGINSVQFYTAPYRSYVVAAKLKNGLYPDGNFWDLSTPHHAISTHPIHHEQPEIMMVAGSHHKTGQSKNASSHYQDLIIFLETNFEIEKVAYQWSAQHYQSADAAPYIGLAYKGSKRIYMATGYFADGLVYGTVAGILLSDLILGNKNPWSKIYNARRFKPLASAAFLNKEGTNVFMQYMKDYPFIGTENLNSIKKDEGKVIEKNQEKYAVYRDETGELHIVSAVCTHMKCIVNWNNAEKTWDCPCHGSRFDYKGNVIEGPAIENLTSKDNKDF